MSDGVDDHSEGDQSASEDSREVVDESDSSEDEVHYNISFSVWNRAAYLASLGVSVICYSNT